MRWISWNVNGLRAASRKGFLDWLAAEDAGVVCLQEIKAKPVQLLPELREPLAYHAYYHAASRPGYSGVALFSKREPRHVVQGIGDPVIDAEGRVLTAYYPDLILINAYFPHARRDLSRRDFKLDFCERFAAWLGERQRDGRPLILCGDLNISHRAIDLARPKQNEGNAGFLPEERAWMDRLLEMGLVDIFRQHHGSGGFYTWWSYAMGCRERNIGWRIDYHLIDARLRERVAAVGHQPSVLGSDHCPVYLDLY